MGMEDNLLALMDLIYEAAFDASLWSAALTRLADTTGTAQVSFVCRDDYAKTCDTLAPRTDPAMDALYKNHWAFHDPLLFLIAQRPPGTVFSFDSILSRRDFSSTPVFNEWFRPAEFGFAAIAANILIEDQISALLCVANSFETDDVTQEQKLAFKTALPHFVRAVRIHRELQIRDLDHDTAPARLENLQRGVVLVDRAARVLFANATARTLLGSGGGLIVKAGCLHSTDGSNLVQGLIASCARKVCVPNGLGGEMTIERGPCRSPLRVTVTPLRAKGTVAEIPWLGLDIPVALVTVIDPAREKWMQ
jgi:hypothetical protein